MRRKGILLCFGDSNTYGYDSRNWMGGRYPKEVRWTGIVERESGWEVKNYGKNGRSIPQGAAQIRAVKELIGTYGQEEGPVVFLVMLGTNDLLADPSPNAGMVAEKMRRFLESAMVADPVQNGKIRMWLVGPPALQKGSWVENERQIEESRRLGGQLSLLAKRLGIPFTDAGQWELPVLYDGVHLSEEGHQRFAREVLKVKWEDLE